MLSLVEGKRINIMSLEIPATERKHMAALVSAKVETLDALRKVLSQCAPALQHKQLYKSVAEKLQDVTDASSASIYSILRTLLAVYSVLRVDGGMAAPKAAAEAVAEIQKDSDAYGTPPAGWSVFQRQLESLLSDDDVLGTSAKALAVASDTQRHVHSVRILTDARPIFGAEVSDGPKAFSVIHTLKIEYFEDWEEREWFVALDDDDLRNLRDAAERALAKQNSTRLTLRRLNLPVLTWKLTNDDE